MPKKSLRNGDGKIKVSRTHVYYEDGEKKEDEVLKEDQIEVNRFETNVATVSIKKGITKNLGNYESVRVDVMVSVPCYVEEIDTIYDELDLVVDEQINQQLEAINE